MKYSVKAKALYFLSRREYGYLELFTKLKRQFDDEYEISRVLNDLVGLGYLSDERYVKSYLTSKSGKYGLLKLKYSLNQKVDNPELVQQMIDDINIDEVAIAKEILIKKFGGIANSSVDKARQSRFLVSRGFSFGVIGRLFRSAGVKI